MRTGQPSGETAKRRLGGRSRSSVAARPEGRTDEQLAGREVVQPVAGSWRPAAVGLTTLPYITITCNNNFIMIVI